MEITAIKTKPIIPGDSLLDFLDMYLPPLEEREIIVITSKIVSICEGAIVKNNGSVDKHDLIRKEADFYIEEHSISRYNVILTIKNNTLIANSGIDESNGNGNFILWPKDVHKTCQQIWEILLSKHSVKDVGVLIIDTRVTPLRWGTLGVALAWCGFEPLKNYIGTPDIYGKKLRMTKASVIDGLAAAADLVMGQGGEQTPLAHIRDVPFITFLDQSPTKESIKELSIDLEDDLFSPLTNSPKWQKGGSIK